MPFTQEQQEKLEAVLREMNQGDGQEEPKVAAPKQDSVFKIKFGDQEIEYRDSDDLQSQLAEIREAQLREAQSQAYMAAQQQFQQAQPKPKEKEPEGPQFDQDTYARLFVTDPVKAAAYVDQFKPKNDEPVKQLQMQVAEVAQVIATQQFLNSTPDYDPTDVNKQVILGLMQQSNLPWTANNLSMVYSFAKDKGYVKPRQVETAEEPEAQEIEQPQARKPKTPSIPRKVARTDEDFVVNFEKLPLNKQREYLESLQN